MRTLPPAGRRSNHARLRRLLVLSFPVAFALHDLEEVLVADRWGRTAPSRIDARFPAAPASIRRLASVSTSQMAVAVTVVAAGVTVGSVLAWRRRDADLEPLPALMAAFTAHGLTHLGASAVLRMYTPGVATVPLVIAPYSLWAWRSLSSVGWAPRHLARSLALGAVAAVVVAAVGQVVSRVVGCGSPCQARLLARSTAR